MENMNIMALGMVVCVVSFLGFVVENIWLAVTRGYIDNRNMCFPFLIGYGIAILLIYMMLGMPGRMYFWGKAVWVQNKIVRFLLYFVAVMLCVCVGEILLGTLVEKTCHFYWWDYSQIPLHITRYTSIPTSILFSLLIMVFMEVFFEPLYCFFQKWDTPVLFMVSSLLLMLMAGDFIYNAWRMYTTQRTVRRWKIYLGRQIAADCIR